MITTKERDTNMNLNALKEYIRLHLISLEQDMATIKKQFQESDEDYEDTILEDVLILDGQIQATSHLLSVANDMANNKYADRG
jgi:hypothetical protein